MCPACWPNPWPACGTNCSSSARLAQFVESVVGVADLQHPVDGCAGQQIPLHVLPGGLHTYLMDGRECFCGKESHATEIEHQFLGVAQAKLDVVAELRGVGGIEFTVDGDHDGRRR